MQRGETLGRLASKVAKLIRGKHKVNYTPHVDCGDNVVVINAEKVITQSGNKMAEGKTIHKYLTVSYPGGQRFINCSRGVEAKQPLKALVEKAVKRNVA